MKQLLYWEIPTPDTAAVRHWLHQDWQPPTLRNQGEAIATPDGLRIPLGDGELSVFVWSLQRTTYLKVFRWADRPLAGERQLANQLKQDAIRQFPPHYPQLPEIDLSQQSIFDALLPHYPETVKHFQNIPNGEYDLNRVYWWEKRWREGVLNPETPKQVVSFTSEAANSGDPDYDLIYLGGALGVIHAAVMARRGYRVLLIERLPFGRMNREWNISRDEFQSLINLGLFSPEDFEQVIACEYIDGFNKFFDANNPPRTHAKVLHTPKVLNISVDAEQLLRICGDKLRAAGGVIWDETEFVSADIGATLAEIQATHLPSGESKQARGRLLVDAMGSASPIAWQLNGGRTFNSVCPTVGAAISGGFDPQVWDHQFGDVLHSHGDISRGRQLIWELFPGRDGEVTIYLFHYHEIHPENPGSLLEMYEDFFQILPEYRRCDVDQLQWRKATFGYIPGHFSQSSRDRQVAWNRLVAIGDSACLQSPLIFTGFGSLVRNMERLTQLLDTALTHDLLDATNLDRIRAYQSNVAVTWLFSKGMMVPTGKQIAPEKINAMLNVFFGLLADEPLEVAETFIKDRTSWGLFNGLALKAAVQHPEILLWIWQLAGPWDLLRWTGSYLNFTKEALVGWSLSWIPRFSRWAQPWAEKRYPSLWLWLQAMSYSLTEGLGRRFSPQ
ncbi:flavin-dependent dehydrogenase [Phormidium yuhuli AB48]|uniref:Flavin-dependent dehydrogenase n=1 Tax=Phormidium yuhuli AB48 TaxID=2940671 RepID=A0ABY5AR72_9CYAN|nr:flavin-dependent dehydrogenase [Phormidium yuhuli]USR91722.1 flavin-dependent dehydrogenase [Phormidium yuhuli AB48]